LYQITVPPEPLTKGVPLPDPRPLCPLSSTEFVNPPKKFLGTPLQEGTPKASRYCMVGTKIIIDMFTKSQHNKSKMPLLYKV